MIGVRNLSRSGNLPARLALIKDRSMAQNPQTQLPFDPAAVPAHVAIIMDGNGRWAQALGKARVEGHQAGAVALRRVLEACRDWKIGYLTVYAFSTENWKRPQAEVDALMHLLERYLASEIEEMERNSIRLRIIGDIARMPDSTRQALQASMERLKGGTRQMLTLALNYGGRDEIVRAARKVAARVAAGELKAEDITEEMLAEQLDTAGIPDPDIIIRTAGEMRLSNFMLWQASYAEYYSTPVCWPDFGREELGKAIADYQRRTRKFGALEGDSFVAP